MAADVWGRDERGGGGYGSVEREERSVGRVDKWTGGGVAKWLGGGMNMRVGSPSGWTRHGGLGCAGGAGLGWAGLGIGGIDTSWIIEPLDPTVLHHPRLIRDA